MMDRNLAVRMEQMKDFFAVVLMALQLALTRVDEMAVLTA